MLRIHWDYNMATSVFRMPFYYLGGFRAERTAFPNESAPPSSSSSTTLDFYPTSDYPLDRPIADIQQIVAISLNVRIVRTPDPSNHIDFDDTLSIRRT